MDIEHTGRVEGLIGDRVRVNFISHSSCASCQLKGVCSVSDVKEKYVDTMIPAFDVKPGDKVNITLQQSLGLKAVFLAYVLPLLMLLSSLFILNAILKNEGLAGLISLAGTAVYYIVLYQLRQKIEKQFNFVLKKID